MRKVLLGTTALAAAALIAAPAMADDEMMEGPVTVGLSGYAIGIVGVASDDMNSDGDPLRGEEVFNVFEFAISGSTTLDNGITVGVHAQVGTSGEFTGAEASRPFDEQHITVSGSFGSLKIGRTESASFNATVYAPGGGVGFIGVNDPWYSPAAKPVHTNASLATQDAQKVVYTSPNFNGLTIGLSYAPEGKDGSAGAGRTTGDADEMSEHAALGVSYSTGFMDGGTLSIGLGYEMATNESGGPDKEATRAGASVSVDEISFGGGLLDTQTDGAGGSMQYDVGASWSQGSMTVGAQYGADDDGGTGMAALHLTYVLGPGIEVGGQVASGTADGEDDVTQFLLGTAVFF